jgi:hypothetical protein
MVIRLIPMVCDSVVLVNKNRKVAITLTIVIEFGPERIVNFIFFPPFRILLLLDF